MTFALILMSFARGVVSLSQRVWWIVAIPKEWDWGRLRKGKRVEYRCGRLQRNYPLVQPGELVIGYQSTPDKKIMSRARTSPGLAKDAEAKPAIELSYLHDVNQGLTYDELLADPVLSKSEGRPCRGPTARRVIDLFDDIYRHTLSSPDGPPSSS